MGDFIISTDSNADLSKEFVKENNICVIPHYYSVEEKEYGDGEELTIQEFYNEMRNKKKVGTMASNPAVILREFAKYAKEGKDILHISFSSALSAAYGNIVMSANEVMEEYPNCKIIVVDTLSAALGEKLMILKALECKSQGKTIEETKVEIEALIPHICIQFTVDDLDYLFRGGRLSKASALLGTLISVKPILYINEEGKLLALEKVRGRKKSLTAMVDNMEKRLGSFRDKQIAICIMHGDCEGDAEYVRELIKERFGYDKFIVRAIGPSIGAHSGPGTVGIAFLGDFR
ncbi:DegV family protein [Lachnospiraceae bacterium OttesenSCG-928-D06]|nr:DegV family protein [Lachnospiraceae bacterium OttesenSCG-928-D06]